MYTKYEKLELTKKIFLSLSLLFLFLSFLSGYAFIFFLLENRQVKEFKIIFVTLLGVSFSLFIAFVITSVFAKMALIDEYACSDYEEENTKTNLEPTSKKEKEELKICENFSESDHHELLSEILR